MKTAATAHALISLLSPLKERRYRKGCQLLQLSNMGDLKRNRLQAQSGICTVLRQLGLTPEYEKGEAAQTDITCHHKQDEGTLTITPPQGTYVGVTDKRTFRVWTHGTEPVCALVSSPTMREGLQGWQFHIGARTARLHADEGLERKTLQAVHILMVGKRTVKRGQLHNLALSPHSCAKENVL